MHVSKAPTTRIALAAVGLFLLLTGCDSPEQSYQRAMDARSDEAFQHVIDKYPDSEFAKDASVRLEELAIWNELRLGGTPAGHRDYLASYPRGLFRSEAQRALAAMAAADWAMIEGEVDANVLGAFVAMHQGTEYAALAKSRLDSVRLARNLAAVWIRDEYRHLPHTLDSLTTVIRNRERDRDSRIARRAYEDVLIARIDAMGPEDRFVLAGVDVHGRSGAHRFSFKRDPSAKETLLHTKAASRGNWRLAPGEVKCEGTQDATLMFTDYPGDEVCFRDQGILQGGEGTLPTQHMDLLFFDPEVHCTDGSVWRFYGDVPAVEGYDFCADSEDGLAFYLLAGQGPVFLHGRGEVVHQDSIIYSSRDADEIP